jgi:hypothetical protein
MIIYANKMNKKAWAVVLVVAFIGVVGLTHYTALAQSSSETYSVDEVFFGSGGEVDLSSENFRGQGSAGSLGVGKLQVRTLERKLDF